MFQNKKAKVYNKFIKNNKITIKQLTNKEKKKKKTVRIMTS